jgi:hypothetical protein
MGGGVNSPLTKVTMWSPHVRLRVHEPWETHQRRNYLYCNCNYCVLASIAIELDQRFRKLLGETETEFVRNSNVLVDFEVRT